MKHPSPRSLLAAALCVSAFPAAAEPALLTEEAMDAVTSVSVTGGTPGYAPINAYVRADPVIRVDKQHQERASFRISVGHEEQGSFSSASSSASASVVQASRNDTPAVQRSSSSKSVQATGHGPASAAAVSLSVSGSGPAAQRNISATAASSVGGWTSYTTSSRLSSRF